MWQDLEQKKAEHRARALHQDAVDALMLGAKDTGAGVLATNPLQALEDWAKAEARRTGVCLCLCSCLFTLPLPLPLSPSQHLSLSLSLSVAECAKEQRRCEMLGKKRKVRRKACDM